MIAYSAMVHTALAAANELAREGTIASRATPLHLGRTTQVWDAVVSHKDTGKTIALFRCTQLVLYPK